MMQFFKSIWMRMRKSNGLPGNTVLVPMTDLPRGSNITVTTPTTDKTTVSAGTSTPVIEQKTKRKYVRRKSNVTH
jgi:hypothetical protein